MRPSCDNHSARGLLRRLSSSLTTRRQTFGVPSVILARWYIKWHLPSCKCSRHDAQPLTVAALFTRSITHHAHLIPGPGRRTFACSVLDGEHIELSACAEDFAAAALEALAEDARLTRRVT